LFLDNTIWKVVEIDRFDDVYFYTTFWIKTNSQIMVGITVKD